MTTKELLKGIQTSSEIIDMEITDVCCDSRKVTPNSMFVCIKGDKTDGCNYAEKAVNNGAVALVVEEPLGTKVMEIVVDNSHLAYAKIAANFYGSPAEKLKLIGVTGTNGKTSTTYIIKHILEAQGKKVGLIGTMQNMIGDKVLSAKYTTPEAMELHKLFADMAAQDVEYVVMEVSSHSLVQGRVAGLTFNVGVFTNLTQDHLDYHLTMENYLTAKQELFKVSQISVINLDDPASEKMLEVAEKYITYSIDTDMSDFTAKNLRYNAEGVDYEIVGKSIIGRAQLKIPGRFSVYNSLAAAVTALALDVPFLSVLEALKTAKGIKGRVEIVPTDRDFSVIIDYAHTPDALEKVINSLKGVAGRIVTVFGCGGDRDKTKRPQMGNIATEISDFVIVTSDNPRSEKPSQIINDIVKGIKRISAPYITIENRREAIKYALTNAKPNDIILLAGKGHETYQILNEGTIHFDEREVVAKILNEMKNAECVYNA
jgi:UDP-N-acetylmuramoyl-L-alanyl-D-glutamate--2,6-diaminopimelate ligase